MEPNQQNRMKGWSAQFLALTLLYILLEWISSLHEFKGLPFAAWDPGLGLLFCALILRPAVGAPALFAGIICAEVLFLPTASNFLRAGTFALIITLVYTATAQAITRIDSNFDVSLQRMRDVALLVISSVMGALCSAALLISLLVTRGELDRHDILTAGWPHVVGDVIGIATVTPLGLKLARTKLGLQMASVAKAWPELLCFSLCVSLFATLILRTGEGATLQYFYIFFIPTMLAAARFGLFGASLMLVATELSLVILLEWVDADASHFTAYQTVMLVLAMTGLLVGTLISERDAARLKATALEEEATRAARFNLVSGMASAILHDLSQPLTAARARARTVQLLSDAGDLLRLKENLGPLLTQIDRASTLLHAIRDFMGRGTSTRSVQSWDSITSTVQMLLEPLADERQIKLIFNSDETLTILCERNQIEQVLVNLIGNAMDALQHSSDDKCIRVEARAHARHAEISITDNGPGIDPDVAPRLFETLVTSKSTGLGLGLVICKSIIEAHEGRLWLEKSQSGLTEFRFTLPLSMESKS